MKIKKFLLFFLISSFLVITLFSAYFLIFIPTDDSITEKNLNTAINEASVSNKAVILLFYADWCPVCQRFFETTLSNNSVHENLNRNYIVVNVETSLNPGIRDRYNVKKRPTLIFLNQKGKESKRIEGYIDTQGLLSQLN